MKKPSVSYHPPAIVKPLQLAFRIFEGNYNQLMQCLGYVEDPKRIQLWSGYRIGLWSAIEEITRLFHNYAASAITIEYHSKALFGGLAKISELSSFMSEYNKEKKVRFDESEKHQLILGLRHYIMHIQTTEMGAIYSFDRVKGHKHTIIIRTTPALLKWRDWKKFPKALAKLKREVGGIPLLHLVEEYHNDVVAFNRWLWDKQRELIKKGITVTRIIAD